MLRATIFYAIALAFCGSASAGGPIQFNSIDSDDTAWFYNRPGVTLPQLGEDLEACQRFGQQMQSGTNNEAYTSHGLVGALVVTANSAAPVRAFADNCMIARGYRRFAPAERNQRAFLRRFEAMSEAARLALASSETPPEGTLARAWDNVYWYDEATRTAERPSIIMRTGSRDFVQPEKIEPVDLSAAISLGQDQALLVLRLGPSDSSVIQISRHDPISGVPHQYATRSDGRRMRLPMIEIAVSERESGAAPRWYAWIVPAGYYAISGVWARGGFMSSFCMGTPAFNAELGSVLYLGDYTMRREPPGMPRFFGTPGAGVRIDVGDLDAARAGLAASPDIAARLAAAEYHNGFVRACPWELIVAQYGLDLPNAPWLASDATSPSP